MQIDGEWLLCDDGIGRPVIRGEILTGDGLWVPSASLVGTSAERTVFSAPVLTALHLQPIATQEHLGSLGGIVASVIIETQVRFRREAGGQVLFRRQYAAVAALEALDISVLSRDITSLFAVIVDRPGNSTYGYSEVTVRHTSPAGCRPLLMSQVRGRLAPPDWRGKRGTPSLGTWRTFAQGFLKAWQSRGQCCFIELLC